MITTNEVFFDLEAVHGMKTGLDVGANAVRVTLGYGGRTVFIGKQGFPTIVTKDGVSIITAMRLNNMLHDAGLRLIQDVSTKTALVVGDGTTSVCILMQEIISEGLKLKQSGVNVIELKRGMEKSCKSIIETINKNKKSVGSDKKLLRQIATVSANNDIELGVLIGDIFDKVGKHGTIRVEPDDKEQTTIDVIDGFQFNSGFHSNFFINNPANTCELEKSYILIVEGKIEKFSQISPILEKVIHVKRPITIIAEDFDHQVLADVLHNVKNTNHIKASLIRHNTIGQERDDLLLDLCAVTGATLITPKTGRKIEGIELSDLGECELISSNRNETTIFRGKQDKSAMSLRISDAKSKMESARGPFAKDKLELRLAKLIGGIAICYVGGVTPVEVSEKKDRIDDAIKATKAALEEGVVIGGGSMFMRCIDDLSNLKWVSDGEMAGINLIKKSITKLLWQISENAGDKGDLIVEKVKEKKGNFGYNAKTGKIEDLFKAGIIDPAKVVRVVAENAISGAIQFLLSEVAIVDEVVTNK